MMKKKYQNVEIYVTSLNAKDIITLSDDIGDFTDLLNLKLNV